MRVLGSNGTENSLKDAHICEKRSLPEVSVSSEGDTGLAKLETSAKLSC